jgi:hypothetical protein
MVHVPEGGTWSVCSIRRGVREVFKPKRAKRPFTVIWPKEILSVGITKPKKRKKGKKAK